MNSGPRLPEGAGRVEGGIAARPVGADSVAPPWRGLVMSRGRLATACCAYSGFAGVVACSGRRRQLGRSSKWERGLIRPTHGFPRRAGEWQRRPPRAWRRRQPGRAWLAAVDQVCGFRVAIHLLEPPLTEMPGRSQVHEQPVPAAAPNGARTTRHCAGPGAKPQGTAEARTDGGHGCAASGAGAAWVRSAARFRSARRSTPAGHGHQLREWFPQGRRLGACGTPGSRTGASRAGNDCDACSLAMSKGQEPFGRLQWTPDAAAASTWSQAMPAPSGARGRRLGGR